MTHKIFIATISALLLVACGKEAPAPTPTSSTKPAETVATPAATPAAAPAAPAAAVAPADAAAPAVPTATPAAAPAAIGALDDTMALAIMGKAGCVACHSIDKKILGPSYKEVAAKRKGESDAAAMLMKKVRDGGKGAYGQIPMPPNPQGKISDDELKAMVAWILTK